MASDACRETLTQTSVQRQIDEEITCSICGKLFNDPKTIPCLHTFCKSCLQGSIESNKKMAVDVSCPLCRVPLLRDEIASIPTNRTIKLLIEILQKKKNDMQMLSECDNCCIRRHNNTNNRSTVLTAKPIEEVTEVAREVSGTANSASFWCVQCEICLCEKCFDAHSQWGEFAKHECVAIEELARNPKSVLSASVALKLKELEMCMHHSKLLDFYCKTCRCLICHYCATKDHRDHDFEDKLTKVVDEERLVVKNVTAPLQELLERVRRAVKKLQDTEKQIEVEGEANVEKIRATYDEVHKLLRRHEEEAIDKANVIKESYKKRIAAQKDDAKVLENDLATCDEFCTKIMEVDKKRLLLTYGDWVKNRVVRLKSEVDRTSLDPEFNAVDIVVRCPEPVEFINNLGSEAFDVPCLQNCILSRYAARKPAVPRSHVTAFGNFLPAKTKIDTTDQIKATVILRDRFGFPVTDQSGNLKVYCNNRDEGFLQDLVITEQSDGEYHIWYNPKTRENHSLQVYWKEHLVNCKDIKVLMTVRNYTQFRLQPAKIIDKYGSSNMHLLEPSLLAKGPNNEVIVYNHTTTQLVVFDKQFQYSHVIGGAGDGNGKFRCITGIAVDRNGYLYTADYILHYIQKFKLSGDFISQFGGGGTSGDNMRSPLSLVVSQSEQLFVCDSDKHIIKVFQLDKFAYSFGQHGTEPGSFNRPQDLALNNSEDQLFITDRGNNRVQVFTPKGKFLRFFDTFPGVVFRLKTPFGIHYAPDGHLLVICKDNNCVLVLKDDGTFVQAIESRQGKRFSDLYGVMVMDDGQTVIADKSNNRLAVF